MVMNFEDVLGKAKESNASSMFDPSAVTRTGYAPGLKPKQKWQTQGIGSHRKHGRDDVRNEVRRVVLCAAPGSERHRRKTSCHVSLGQEDHEQEKQRRRVYQPQGM